VTKHATQSFIHFYNTSNYEIVFNIIMMMIITDVNIGSMPYMSSVQWCTFWTSFFRGFF
jgi:hypothetical protein